MNTCTKPCYQVGLQTSEGLGKAAWGLSSHVNTCPRPCYQIGLLGLVPCACLCQEETALAGAAAHFKAGCKLIRSGGAEQVLEHWTSATALNKCFHCVRFKKKAGSLMFQVDCHCADSPTHKRPRSHMKIYPLALQGCDHCCILMDEYAQAVLIAAVSSSVRSCLSRLSK